MKGEINNTLQIIKGQPAKAFRIAMQGICLNAFKPLGTKYVNEDDLRKCVIWKEEEYEGEQQSNDNNGGNEKKEKERTTEGSWDPQLTGRCAEDERVDARGSRKL